MEQEVKPEERLAEIARRLRSGESAPVTTVRTFLSWFFGAQRRGQWIVSYIRRALDQAGLRTEPDFESAYLDAEMQFVLANKRNSAHLETITAEVAETITETTPAHFLTTFGVSKACALGLESVCCPRDHRCSLPPLAPRQAVPKVDFLKTRSNKLNGSA
jgi:hypothetical protein